MFRRHIAGLSSSVFDRRRHGAIFDPPKPPAPPPPPPELDEPLLEKARRRERKLRQRRQGLRATVLTAGLGDEASGAGSGRKTLLGH